MRLEKFPLKLCLFSVYLRFVVNFFVLASECNLLLYFVKYLVLLGSIYIIFPD